MFVLFCMTYYTRYNTFWVRTCCQEGRGFWIVVPWLSSRILLAEVFILGVA